MVVVLKLTNDTTHNKGSWTAGSTVVDMTLMNPSFQFSLNNPIAFIPPPMPKTAQPLAYANVNAVGINIGMMYPYITITFTDKASGFSNDPFNMTNGTLFQRMYQLAAQDKYRKLLFVNTTTNPNFVHITDWKCNVQPGHMNIVNHTLVLAVVGAMSM